MLLKTLALLSLTAMIPLATGQPAAPASTISLSMPGGGLDLSISYRQIETDLRPFLEGSGLDEQGLHKLRVSALLAQGGKLVSDMELLVGETLLPPGRYALGFTVGSGEKLNFFLATGSEAIGLGSDALEPGWISDRLVLQLVYSKRNETHLIWHLGNRAGRITLHPGGVERERETRADDAPGR